MIKRPAHQAFANRDQGIVVLYDHARHDVFAATDHVNDMRVLFAPSAPIPKQRIPSITTTMLLQLQVGMIQMIGSIPSKPPVTAHAQAPATPPADRITEKSTDHVGITTERKTTATVKGCLQTAARWSLLFGLVVLDNVGRVLGVEEEMADVCQEEKQQDEDDEDEDEHRRCCHLQQQRTVSFHGRDGQDESTAPPEAAPAAPIPTLGASQARARSDSESQPAPGRRTRKNSAPTYSHERQGAPSGHVRTLSNNMTMPASRMLPSSSRHSLRRVEAQRDLVSVRPSTSSSTSSARVRRRVQEEDGNNDSVHSHVHYHQHQHYHPDPSSSAARSAGRVSTLSNGSSPSINRSCCSSPRKRWQP